MNFGKLDHKAREAIRIKAVEAIVKQGMTQSEVAELFGVGKVSVNRWMK